MDNFYLKSAFCLPTALLLHSQEDDNHYDWLVANPGAAEGRLWTARINYPSKLWGEMLVCDLQIIAPHRRKYLTFEGDISDNRGHVQRIDEGFAACECWEKNKIILHLKMKYFAGLAHLLPVSGNHWKVSFNKQGY